MDYNSLIEKILNDSNTKVSNIFLDFVSGKAPVKEASGKTVSMNVINPVTHFVEIQRGSETLLIEPSYRLTSVLWSMNFDNPILGKEVEVVKRDSRKPDPLIA